MGRNGLRLYYLEMRQLRAQDKRRARILETLLLQGHLFFFFFCSATLLLLTWSCCAPFQQVPALAWRGSSAPFGAYPWASSFSCP